MQVPLVMFYGDPSHFASHSILNLGMLRQGVLLVDETEKYKCFIISLYCVAYLMLCLIVERTVNMIIIICCGFKTKIAAKLKVCS